MYVNASKGGMVHAFEFLAAHRFPFRSHMYCCNVYTHFGREVREHRCDVTCMCGKVVPALVEYYELARERGMFSILNSTCIYIYLQAYTCLRRYENRVALEPSRYSI